jgi:hypothetical protein
MTPQAQSVAIRAWWRVSCLVIAVAMTLIGCHRAPPDRRADAEKLTQQIRALPGVAGANTDFTDRYAEGNVHFWLTVDVSDAATAEQVGAVAARYLDGLRAVDYGGYDTELDVRHGADLFAVDSGQRVVANTVQIVAQARDWVGLRHEFPGATVTLRAAVEHSADGSAHPDRGHPSFGVIDMPDAGYTAVSAAITGLGAQFPQLSSGTWTVSTSGNAGSAQITASQRFPTGQELQVWSVLNADQTIAHADAMTINAPQVPPVWISEQVFSHDPATALALAARHLPTVATLPAPLLYTATDQLQGHRDYNARTTGPVAVTLGGCTVRTYRPEPTEQGFINAYERCRA